MGAFVFLMVVALVVGVRERVTYRDERRPFLERLRALDDAWLLTLVLLVPVLYVGIGLTCERCAFGLAMSLLAGGPLLAAAAYLPTRRRPVTDPWARAAAYAVVPVTVLAFEVAVVVLSRG